MEESSRVKNQPAISLAAARGKVETMRSELEAGLPPKTETFRAICEEYLRRAKVRTKAGRQRTLERLVYPSLGSRPIEDVRRSEIIRLLDGIEDANGSLPVAYWRKAWRSEMTWAEIEEGDWTLPAARNKTKIDLARPLSKTAQDTLPMPRQGEFVFSTTAAPRP